MAHRPETFMSFHQPDHPDDVTQWTTSDNEFRPPGEQVASYLESHTPFNIPVSSAEFELSAATLDTQYIGDPYYTQVVSPHGRDSIGPSSTSPSSAGPTFGVLNTTGSNSAETDAADELISAAIEEDKRRRNTAASARFRLKKKEREADLERRTREMGERCEELQRRIGALETENRWLRELITERSRNRDRKKGRPRETAKDKKKVDET